MQRRLWQLLLFTVTAAPGLDLTCILNEPLASTDVKTLTSDSPDIVHSLAPAFQRYNESQLVTVKLPGGSQEVGFLLRYNTIYLIDIGDYGVELGYCHMI